MSLDTALACGQTCTHYGSPNGVAEHGRRAGSRVRRRTLQGVTLTKRAAEGWELHWRSLTLRRQGSNKALVNVGRPSCPNKPSLRLNRGCRRGSINVGDLVLGSCRRGVHG
jgi:hypothetical protein